MTFLPIVERELRVAARLTRTYRSRALMAAILGIVAIIMLLFGALGPAPAQMGGTMFATLSWMVLGFCLLEGGRTTADCLSEERREGTLGLLFLTDLKGYDVVLGKLAATSLNSIYGLLDASHPRPAFAARRGYHAGVLAACAGSCEYSLCVAGGRDVGFGPQPCRAGGGFRHFLAAFSVGGRPSIEPINHALWLKPGICLRKSRLWRDGLLEVLPLHPTHRMVSAGLGFLYRFAASC